MMQNPTRSTRVMFYVQHLLGIGHIARASRIATALQQAGMNVTVVTGGLPVPGFPAEAIDCVALPPVVASNAGFSGLATADGTPASEEFLHKRRDLLLETFHAIKPDIVIIEAFPFGRRQMRFELVPLMDAIAASTPRPKLISSVRDILQQRSKPGRDEETVATINAHFDHVMVHGDPSFITLPETFPLAAQIAERIVYTGLVAAPLAAEPQQKFDIVVSAGGGAVGQVLIENALEAARQFPDRQWCIIAGPNLPEPDYRAILAQAGSNIVIERFRRDFPSLLRGAQLSISQAGYNTVCDLLQAQCRSILIPFTTGGETEQAVRAERLQALGIAISIAEDALNADLLADVIHRQLQQPKPGAMALDLDGARHTAQFLQGLMGK